MYPPPWCLLSVDQTWSVPERALWQRLYLWRQSPESRVAEWGRVSCVRHAPCRRRAQTGTEPVRAQSTKHKKQHAGTGRRRGGRAPSIHIQYTVQWVQRAAGSSGRPLYVYILFYWLSLGPGRWAAFGRCFCFCALGPLAAGEIFALMRRDHDQARQDVPDAALMMLPSFNEPPRAARVATIRPLWQYTSSRCLRNKKTEFR
jgi:hypothetical protein